jgi:ABC-2 type transport system ATP-binding protein
MTTPSCSPGWAKETARAAELNGWPGRCSTFCWAGTADGRRLRRLHLHGCSRRSNPSPPRQPDPPKVWVIPPLPRTGTVRLIGLDPEADRDQVHEIVGVQLQQSAFPAKLRVGEILDEFRSFYRHPADVTDLVEVLGLGDKRRAYYRSLSGGHRQRLSVALALIGGPQIAVLDEMTTGLDPQARRDAWGLIEGIRARGVTIVLVTHFMEEAERLCDRVALIDHGRIAALDTPAGLATRAQGGKTVRFVPSASVDDRLLAGLPEVTQIEHEGQHVIVTGTGELVNAVILALNAAGLQARDVQLDASSLEDAFVRLTGTHPEGEQS